MLLLAFNAYSSDSIKITIKNKIIKSGILFPDIVYKQSVLETGNFKSKAYKTRNNLFGFMYRGKIMYFKSIDDCIAYMKKWQLRHYKSGDYYKFLIKKGYAKDKMYIKKLKKIK